MKLIVFSSIYIRCSNAKHEVGRILGPENVVLKVGVQNVLKTRFLSLPLLLQRPSPPSGRLSPYATIFQSFLSLSL
jgi:hypothetical protein